MERALRLVADRKITLASISADQLKRGKLIIADVNPTTLKRNVNSVAFSEDLWGDDVGDYYTNIKSLKKVDMDKIIFAGRKFSRATQRDDDDDDDLLLHLQEPVIKRSARAHIPLNYDDDDDDEDEDGNDDDMDAVNADEQAAQEARLETQFEQEPIYDEEGNLVDYQDMYEEEEEDIEEEEDEHPVEDYDYENQQEDGMSYEDGHALDDMDTERCVFLQSVKASYSSLDPQLSVILFSLSPNLIVFGLLHLACPFMRAMGFSIFILISLHTCGFIPPSTLLFRFAILIAFICRLIPFWTESLPISFFILLFAVRCVFKILANLDTLQQTHTFIPALLFPLERLETILYLCLYHPFNSLLI